MIHEFAIDPELVVEWLKKPETYFHILRGAFGKGESRVVSEYPTDWEVRVKDRWSATLKTMATEAVTPVEKGRVDELRTVGDMILQQLFSARINRARLSWSSSKSWLENALEHHPEPLQSIVARRRPGIPAHVLTEDDIFESLQWKIQRSRWVARDPATLAQAVAPLLGRCANIIFVDPWFRPSAHMNSFREFLRATERRFGMSAPNIRIRTSRLADKRGVGWAFFENEFKSKIEAELFVGWKARIVVLKERSNGEELHNRYILSELGGIVFAKGLDSGSAATSDDLSLMGREQFELRWRQHMGSPGAFEIDFDQKEVILEGRLNPVRLQSQPSRDNHKRKR